MARPIETGGYFLLTVTWWLTLFVLAVLWYRSLPTAGW